MNKFECHKEASNNGFTMTFPNGYTVSVRWGWANYCENRGSSLNSVHKYPQCTVSATAEVAVWGTDGNFIQSPGVRGDVWAHLHPQEVAALLFQVSNWQ